MMQDTLTKHIVKRRENDCQGEYRFLCTARHRSPSSSVRRKRVRSNKRYRLKRSHAPTAVLTHSASPRRHDHVWSITIMH